MTDERGSTIGGLWLQGATGLLGAMFGVDLATMCCALIGAWIGAPYARKLKVHNLEAPPDTPPQAAEGGAARQSFLPSGRQVMATFSALFSYFASAVASAVFASYLAGAPTPGNAAFRNALAVGIGIGFYILLAKFIEDPVGFVVSLWERVFGRRPPSGPGEQR